MRQREKKKRYRRKFFRLDSKIINNNSSVEKYMTILLNFDRNFKHNILSQTDMMYCSNERMIAKLLVTKSSVAW